MDLASKLLIKISVVQFVPSKHHFAIKSVNMDVLLSHPILGSYCHYEGLPTATKGMSCFTLTLMRRKNRVVVIDVVNIINGSNVFILKVMLVNRKINTKLLVLKGLQNDTKKNKRYHTYLIWVLFHFFFLNV